MALAQKCSVSRAAARPGFAPRPVVVRRAVIARAGVSEVTDASFGDDVLKSNVPVLVDFWAPCGCNDMHIGA